MSEKSRKSLTALEQKFMERGMCQVLYPIDLLYKKVQKRLRLHLKKYLVERTYTEAQIRRIAEGIAWDLASAAGTSIHGIRWCDWNAQIEYYYEKCPPKVRFSRIDRLISDRLIHWHLRAQQDSRRTGILM